MLAIMRVNQPHEVGQLIACRIASAPGDLRKVLAPLVFRGQRQDELSLALSAERLAERTHDGARHERDRWSGFKAVAA
jgi:hypothetical protein